ncbi:hypothetical protein EYC84_006378 [Monilinia fructicola]|uniref:J domain-containing protein n=1 Tax=Monilinia fructicola TaxID=38448 RepID=A0A5M9K5W0_MONFR|nr:hypothetical protein EYC84_006378 [Monilinia fructicola]
MKSFRLQNEVATHEGADVTFYDLFDIKPSANQEEIRAAYKKKSPYSASRQGQGSVHRREINREGRKAEIKAQYQAASDRFTRLGLINKILLGEGRVRYDSFLKNGFPKWKGTGYYYSRFRPGFGSVLVGLFIFVGGGGHYLAPLFELEETARVPNESKTEAHAGRRIPRRTNLKRRLRRPKYLHLELQPLITGPKKRVVAENGKVLVVDSASNVYLEQADEDGKMREFLLDLDEFPAPTVRDTALFRLPVFAFNKTIGRVFNKAPVEEEYENWKKSHPTALVLMISRFLRKSRPLRPMAMERQQEEIRRMVDEHCGFLSRSCNKNTCSIEKVFDHISI